MSFDMNNVQKSNKIKTHDTNSVQDVDEIDDNIIKNVNVNKLNYSVTTIQKTPSDECSTLSDDKKSCINIHSTDLCQMTEALNSIDLRECNLEVLSLNQKFPSTSEESLSNDDTSLARNKENKHNEIKKTCYVPTNSKSTTGSRRNKEQMEAQTSGYSDFNIPKNTLYVIGSNPGEPKMCYPDPPKKISKTMKKLIRNMEKYKADKSNASEKSVNKLNRGILKVYGCTPECTGDSSVFGSEQVDQASANENVTLPFVNCETQSKYSKLTQDKNVKFNTQVVIIHFTGDICLGRSVETLCKEKDQQARNSELRKIFLTKYNDLWTSHN